jgi:hypothetical protein
VKIASFNDLNSFDLFNAQYNYKVRHKFRITPVGVQVTRQGQKRNQPTEISMNQSTALQKQMHLP